jgi:glycosyltransferase involved in cell wall biosynthesis
MKILLFHNRYKSRGGEDVVVAQESELLSRAGHTVEVHEENNDDIIGPLEKARVAVNSAYSQKFYHIAKKRIAQARPDIVHVHNFFPKITPSVFDAAKDAGIPAVLSLHNYRLFCANGLFLREGSPCELCLHGSRWNAVKYRCYRNSALGSYFITRMQERAHRTGVWNDAVAAFLVGSSFAASKAKQGGLAAEKLHVRPNFGPDLAGFRAPEEDFYVYLGRVSPEKGIATLLEAFSRLQKKLVVIGPLDESWPSSAGWGPNVTYLGATSREVAWGWLGRSRGLIFPSECYEGAFPLALVEALSMGVPVISSGLGSTVDFLRAEESALFFPAKDSAGLARAILRIDADPSLRKTLGAKSRATFEGNFTAAHALASIEALYRGLLKPAGTAAKLP